MWCVGCKGSSDRKTSVECQEQPCSGEVFHKMSVKVETHRREAPSQRGVSHVTVSKTELVSVRRLTSHMETTRNACTCCLLKALLKNAFTFTLLLCPLLTLQVSPESVALLVWTRFRIPLGLSLNLVEEYALRRRYVSTHAKRLPLCWLCLVAMMPNIH